MMNWQALLSTWTGGDSKPERQCPRVQQGGQDMDGWTATEKKYRLVPAFSGEKGAFEISKTKLKEYLRGEEPIAHDFKKSRYRKNGKRQWAHFVKKIELKPNN